MRISGVPFVFQVNEEVVHGIPTDKRIIKEGDIVSLDAGVIYEGYHSDAARTVAVGEVSEEAKLLIEQVRQSFIEGMKKQWLEIIFMIFPQQLVTMQISLDMEWSRIFVDMGWSHLHEEPEIPNFRQSRFRRGIKLKPGMTLCRGADD